VLLSPFGGEERPPTSYDVPYYVWRTRLVAVDGLDALARLPDGAIPNPDRAGFPVLGATLGTITRVDTLAFVIALRAVAAISIGAAAAAFAKEALQEPSWSWPWFLVGVGASAAVVGASIGSLEQLVAEVLFLGTAVLAPLVARGRPGTAAAALLLAAAALTHWVFTALFLGVLLVFAAVLAFPRFTRRREGDPARSVERSIRVLRLALVGGATAVLAVTLLPELPHRVPEVVGEKGNLTRLGTYELGLLIPLAAIGVLLGLRGARSTRRDAILLMTVWAAAVPVAMVVSALLPTSLKLFRVAPFALGVPVLAILAIVTLASLASERLGAPGRAVAAAVVLGGLLLAVGTPAATFDPAYGAYTTQRMERARIAGRYVEQVGGDRPIVFTTREDPRLIDRVVRAWVPAERITDTWVYQGTPRDLVTGAPVSDPERAALSSSSQAWWSRSWPRPADVLDRDPLVIDLGPTDRAPAGSAVLAPGLSVVRGPMPAAAEREPLRLGWSGLLVAAIVSLLILAIVGGGWARVLLDVPATSAALLAPAFGIATLTIAGVAVGRSGIPLGGAAGLVLIGATGGAGWLISTLRRSG
jgi:MFS family permease